MKTWLTIAYLYALSFALPGNEMFASNQEILMKDPQKLDIVHVGHPVPRQVAKELSIDEIISPEIQNLIERMKATMRAAPGIGLAAPQIGKSLQLVSRA